jgi:hypothetical protein
LANVYVNNTGYCKTNQGKEHIVAKSHHSTPQIFRLLLMACVNQCSYIGSSKVAILRDYYYLNYDKAHIIKHTIIIINMCDSAWPRWVPILIAIIPLRSTHHPGPDDLDLRQHVAVQVLTLRHCWGQM